MESLAPLFYLLYIVIVVSSCCLHLNFPSSFGVKASVMFLVRFPQLPYSFGAAKRGRGGYNHMMGDARDEELHELQRQVKQLTIWLDRQGAHSEQ